MIKVRAYGDKFFEFQITEMDSVMNAEYRMALDLLTHANINGCIERLENILVHFPMHPRILALLAEASDQNDDLPMSILATNLLHQLYRNALPKTFAYGTHFLPWFYTGNQPFYRNCRHLADLYEETGNYKSCQQICEFALKLDASDELGFRTLLPKIYMEARNTIAMHRLYRAYPDDYAPEILFGILFISLANGDNKSAERYWKMAETQFPLITKELLKTEHFPPAGYNPEIGYYSDTEETAWSYWDFYSPVWLNEPRVTAFLNHKRSIPE